LKNVFDFKIIFEKKNIDKIKHIPTVIVQGRYDVVCPAVSAHDLKKAMQLKLVFGHLKR
jgi:pimeloyl-ACP methyl ester carboxylesterase